MLDQRCNSDAANHLASVQLGTRLCLRIIELLADPQESFTSKTGRLSSHVEIRSDHRFVSSLVCHMLCVDATF